MFDFVGEMPCLEPPMTHASSVEDVELTDEDEEVDIDGADLGNQAQIPEDGSAVGKDVKLDPESDLMKSSNLIKVRAYHQLKDSYYLSYFICIYGVIYDMVFPISF